jgi:FkbM family methyltransferase
MGAVDKIHKVFSLLDNTDSIKAFLTWPKFSLTSYTVVSRLAKQGKLPNTVLDVGAHTGQFTVASAKLFPGVEVHSFEPVPHSVERLRKNVSKLEHVTVYPFALGDREGELTLRVNADNQQSSILPLAQARRDAFPNARETHQIEVKVSTLDRVFAGIDFRPPVLLKLDVQGYEAHTMRGGTKTLQRVDYAIIEASFKPTYEGEPTFMDLARMMEERDFRFECPLNCYAVPRSGAIFEIDALFVRSS